MWQPWLARAASLLATIAVVAQRWSRAGDAFVRALCVPVLCMVPSDGSRVAGFRGNCGEGVWGKKKRHPVGRA